MNYRTRVASLIITTALLVHPSLALAAFDTNLSVGARGSAVIELQQFLIARDACVADTQLVGVHLAHEQLRNPVRCVGEPIA